MSGCCVMALRLQSGKEECEVSNRGEKESEALNLSDVQGGFCEFLQVAWLGS